MRLIKFIMICCVINFLKAENEISTERTFALIKPYAVLQNTTDQIIAMIEDAGFIIIAMKKIQLNREDVYRLYENNDNHHLWFDELLITSMIATPVIAMILEKENAVADWLSYKKVVRSLYGSQKRNNAVHGSDTAKDAEREIALFFKFDEF